MRSLATGLFVVLVACGGGKNDADPRVVPGGGIGDGEINGFLNVHVIDEDTDEPVSGATVMVGEPGAEPLTGVTDSSGLYRFEADISGPQTITAVATGYVTATWYGANGANVTIPVNGEGTADVPQATLTGGIEGWDTMDPDPDHFLIALVQYSQTTGLGDEENNLPQGGIPGQLPANACSRPALGNCNWTLNSRTGEVAIYAILVDIDTNGTPEDDTDDVWEVFGLAHDLSVTVEDGVDQDGIMLTQVDPGELGPIDVTLAAAPSGLTEEFWLVGVELPDVGLLMFPGTSEQEIIMMVPNLSGDFADASYRVVAAVSDAVQDGAQTIIVERNVTDVDGHTAPDWLPLATDLGVTAGAFSFTGVEGAAAHIIDLEDGPGNTVWAIGLFDGRTEFTLPAVDPDPLPSGEITFRVSAFEVNGFDPGDFALDDILDQVTRISANIEPVTP
jgi:hypothetical protein